jgi:hypothetical protein
MRHAGFGHPTVPATTTWRTPIDGTDVVVAEQCVQLRLACSVGVSPTGGKESGTFVAWVASVKETKRMKPTDKAILGMASESPGRNASEPSGGLDKITSGGRARCFGAKAA